MFVKMYQYYIHPEKTEQFWAVQKKPNSLYTKYVQYRVHFLRDEKNPSRWLEIQYYPNQESYEKGQRLVNEDQEIKELWKAFQSVLDPRYQIIQEEQFSSVELDRNGEMEMG